MKIAIKKVFTACCLMLVITACHQTEKSPVKSSFKSNSDSVYLPEFAQGFYLRFTEQGSQLVLKNPWKPGKVYQTMDFPSQALPYNELVVLSASQVGLLESIGATESIVGLTGKRYLYHPELIEQLNQGQVQALGHEGGLNLELLVQLQAQLVIADGFESPNQNLQRIEKTGIPVLYFIDWMETHPLGRLEWIKVMGIITGRWDEAVEHFEQAKTAYLHWSALAKQQDDKPYVFSGNNFKGTWYLAGGKSFLAQLIQDAGAKYRWAKDSTTGSLALSLERVFEQHLEDDFWFNPNAQSLTELEQSDSRYVQFKAFRNQQVYAPNKRMNAQGGNDYWETGMANPHLLLQDFIAILHPELLPEHSTIYFKALESNEP